MVGTSFSILLIIISMLFSALDFIVLNDNIANKPRHNWKSLCF